MRPVLLDAKGKLHEAHFVMPRAAAVSRDDRHVVPATRERAARFPAIRLEPSRYEARGDVVEADSHARFTRSPAREAAHRTGLRIRGTRAASQTRARRAR